MLQTFAKGGVHPKDNKLTQSLPIVEFAIPEFVNISLAQHIGTAALPTVQVGDYVKVGTKIGESSGYISASVHSSVSGTVTKIAPVFDTSGFYRPAITIQTQGDEWEETIIRTPEVNTIITASAEEIKQKIADSGIVGMGGATFPLHVKLTPPTQNKAKYLLINAVECEPYLTSDHRLMLEKAEEIMVGIELLRIALGVEVVYVGIENNTKDAMQVMQKCVTRYTNVHIVPLKVRYPQGGEKQLIQAILGKEVPSGQLPISLGVVVVNVGTAYATYQAVQKNKPLIDRIVTVSGLDVPKPSNFLIRVGVAVQDVLHAAGVVDVHNRKVISGGPMMGKSLARLDVPITKGTSGILVMPEKLSKRIEPENCIRCTRCLNVCPMGLEPYLLQVLAEHKEYEKLELHAITDCIECGSCSYICPSHRPLLDYIRLGKSKVSQIIRNRKAK